GFCGGFFGGRGCGSVFVCLGSSCCLSFSAIGSGFGGCGSGGGVGSFAACNSFLSVTLGLASSIGLGGSSAFFSTSGFGVSTLGASLTPLVISEKSFSLIKSTGNDSAGVTSKL